MTPRAAITHGAGMELIDDLQVQIPSRCAQRAAGASATAQHSFSASLDYLVSFCQWMAITLLATNTTAAFAPGCRRVLCGCHYSRTLERGITPFHVLLDNIRLRPVEASERTCDRITNILNSSVQVS
jgi:hypothetical protein